MMLVILFGCVVALGIVIFGRRWAASRPPSHIYWWGFVGTIVLWCLAAYVVKESCLLHSGELGPCVGRFASMDGLAVGALLYLAIGWTFPVIAFVFAIWQSRRKRRHREGQAQQGSSACQSR